MDKGVSEEKEKEDEVLDGLPDGDDGWEYIEKAEENEESDEEDTPVVGEESEDEGVSDEDDAASEEVESGNVEGDDETVTDGEIPSKIREIEDAVVNGATEYEISGLVDEVGSEIRKNHVIAFVNDAETDVPDSFSPGDIWGEPEDRFVNLGWVNEEGEITAQGASVLCYASDVIADNNGLEVALVGYLNSEGVDDFFKKALRRGPDEGDDDGGLIDGLLG